LGNHFYLKNIKKLGKKD